MVETNITIGGGFASMLTILFITLKLLDKIDWYWFWVLSPIWIPLGIGLIILIVIIMIASFS